MITPRIKPSVFFPEEAPDEKALVRQRKAKLEGYVQTLAAMDELIDFSEMAGAVDVACPRADRSKGGRPPYPTEVLVRMVFLQGLYNLSDEQCEHQVLDRLSFQRFCRLEDALHIPDARTDPGHEQPRGEQGGRHDQALGHEVLEPDEAVAGEEARGRHPRGQALTREQQLPAGEKATRQAQADQAEGQGDVLGDQAAQSLVPAHGLGQGPQGGGLVRGGVQHVEHAGIRAGHHLEQEIAKLAFGDERVVGQFGLQALHGMHPRRLALLACLGQLGSQEILERFTPLQRLSTRLETNLVLSLNR